MRSGPRGNGPPLHVAFVMEQALGHVTHYRNLRAFTDQQSDIAPVWLPIPFEVAGLARILPVLGSNWSVRASWRARRALEGVRALDTVDAVFFHSQVTSLFSTRLMRQVPTLISLDATPVNYDTMGQHYGHRPASNSFLDRKKYELNRRAFHAASGLVTWSDWVRRSLVDDYGIDPGKVRVLAPGAPPMFFDIGRVRTNVLLDPESRPVKLLFVGADFQRKGGPLLLELMESDLGRRCELHIVTQSPIHPKANVFVHRGLQPNSAELRELFANADVFVLPTHADCLAVVLEEAAAAGLPVVTTNVGALSEAVSDGESGIIVPPNDGRALETALEVLIDDPQRRVRMGAAAYGLACRMFDANRNNRALLDFIQDLGRARSTARRAA